MESKGFGALTSNLASIRTYEYSTLPKREMPVGASADLSEYEIPADRMPRLLDQGSVGACVAHAVVEVLEVLYYVETGKKIELSPGFFYGRQRSQWSNGYGMVTDTAIEMTKDRGSVPETIFNDYTEMPDMKKIVNSRPDLDKYAEPYKINGFVKFNWANRNRKWNEIKEALLTYQLPLVAVSDDYFSESHCICIYGFNEKGKRGRELKFQNSWGPNYGTDGKSTIPFDSVDGVWLLLDEKVTLNFVDVPEDAWFYKNVLNLYSAGLINGTSETTFEPESPITRAEVCAIIDRLMTKIEDKDNAMMKSVYDYINRKHNK